LAQGISAGRTGSTLPTPYPFGRPSKAQVESECVIRRLEFQCIRLVATADGYDRGLTGQAIKGYWYGGRVYWMGSAMRSILQNPLYTGCVRWNVGGYVRNPDTAKRVRQPRPQDEWVEHRDEAVRIVVDELFQRAQRRNRIR
jgi:Recombinase